MLTEKHINALGALKAQADGLSDDVVRLAKGCEAEVAHIYRIASAHNT